MPNREHINEAIGDLAKAVFLVFFFLLVHAYVDHRPSGRRLQEFEYALLQDSLNIQLPEDRLPVIVDIADLQAPSTPTDRHYLDQILRQLNDLNARAIGVDIDFSPEDDGHPVQQEDLNYFASWANLPVKPHLGVYRRAADSPANWLGNPKFSTMAAGLAIPTEDRQHNYYYVQSQGSSQPLPQLAAVLFEDFSGSKLTTRASGWTPAPLRETPTASGLSFGTYLVDYSTLPTLKRRIILYHSPEDLAGDARRRLISGNVVLVGDTSAADDQLCISSEAPPISGVLFNASSLAALQQGALMEIDSKRSRDLDFLILAFVGAIAYGIRIAHAFWPPRHRFDYRNLEILLCGFFALVIVAGSLWYVDVHRIFWPDFFWVAAALWLHPFFSEPFWRLNKAIWLGLRSFVHSLVHHEEAS